MATSAFVEDTAKKKVPFRGRHGSPVISRILGEIIFLGIDASKLHFYGDRRFDANNGFQTSCSGVQHGSADEYCAGSFVLLLLLKLDAPKFIWIGDNFLFVSPRVDS